MKNLFTLFCFTQKVTSTNETFASYQQIFEMLSLKQANNLFPIMDELCTHFRKNPAQFTPAVKQGMLRLCNDLLRRLSATGSRDIKFSGKVQLFLTRLFPIDEKSALNLTSNFHLENTTEFTEPEKSGLPLDEAAVKKYLEEDKKVQLEATSGATRSKLVSQMSTATEAGEIKDEADVKSEKMRMPSEDGECDDMDTSVGADDVFNDSTVKKPTIEFKTVGSTTITYKLYRAIWSLQKYFNNPKMLFEEDNFKEFERYAAQVIGLFTDYQVDVTHKNNKGANKTPKTYIKGENAQNDENSATFPKYLTSEQLTHLQIKDPQFRHQIILQFLILVQYVKAPPIKQNLQRSAAMGRWVQIFSKKVDALLMSMNNHDFCQQLMSHEIGWTQWKDRSCPSLLVQSSEKVTFPEHKTISGTRKRNELNCEMLKKESKRLKLAVDKPSEFMEFIKNEKYDDMPTPTQFFDDFKIDDSVWRYKALRLLAEKSRLFFQMPPSKHCFKPLKYYLESMRERIKKEAAEWETVEDRAKREAAEEKKMESATVESDEEEDMEDMNTSKAEEPEKIEEVDPMKEAVTEADAYKLAKCLGTSDDEKLWEIFALRTLRMKVRDLRDIRSDTDKLGDRVKMCIFSWQGSGADTTKEALHNSIKKTPQLASVIKEASDWIA